MTRIMQGASASRVELLVDRAQVLPIDVGVDLRRRDVSMSKHLLYRAQIRAALEQMRRERMSERVGRYVFLQTRLFHVLAEHLPRAHAGERRTARVEKEHALPPSTLETRSQLPHIDRHRPDGTPPDRHEALLAPLPEDTEEGVLEQEVAYPERDPLRDAQTRAVRHLQHGSVTECQWLIERDGIEQPLYFLGGQDVREREPAFRCVETLTRIADEVPFGDEEAKVGADGRDIPANRGRSEADILQVIDEVA